jgi:two-component system cell cycle response regulator DivK
MSMQSSEPNGHAANRKNRFILVVDNNAEDRFAAAMLLQRFSYSVCDASTAAEAEEFISVAVPALILADGGAETGGRDLVARIRVDRRLAQIPVVLLAAEKTTRPEAPSGTAGDMTVLSKPLRAEDLYRVVQGMLETTPRKVPRISVALRAAVDSDKAALQPVVLSEQGMFLRTLFPRPVNSPLSLMLDVNGRTVRIEGVVLYSFRPGEGPIGQPGMGIKFERISQQDTDFLRTLIRDHLEDGIVRPDH